MGNVVAARSVCRMSRYVAMDSALAIRLFLDSRTSFGDPVLPDVDSSSARSG